MPLDLDGLFQEGVDVGRSESAAEIARLRAALEEAFDALFGPTNLHADNPLYKRLRKALAKERE